MARKRIGELFSMMLIGEGVVAFAAPQRYALLWWGGPLPLRRLHRAMAHRPRVVRSLAAVEAVGGLAVALWRLSK